MAVVAMQTTEAEGGRGGGKGNCRLLTMPLPPGQLWQPRGPAKVPILRCGRRGPLLGPTALGQHPMDFASTGTSIAPLTASSQPLRVAQHRQKRRPQVQTPSHNHLRVAMPHIHRLEGVWLPTSRRPSRPAASLPPFAWPLISPPLRPCPFPCSLELLIVEHGPCSCCCSSPARGSPPRGQAFARSAGERACGRD